MKITFVNNNYFRNVPRDSIAKIRQIASDIIINEVEDSDVTIEDLIDTDVIFGRVPSKMLKHLPNLKWIHLPTAGADGLTDSSLYAGQPVLLTKSSGTFGIPIAEHVIGMMITLSHKFCYYYEKQQKGVWCGDVPELLDIYGSNVLIVGIGDIGTEVCKRLLAFGCNIVGIRRDASKPHELIKDVRPISRLRESLPDADYILICAPGTDKTEKMFGRDEFALMKESAIIVNAGRGKIIDTDALIDALNERKIAGAGLDVTDPEPLPPKHPLWSAPNLLITPHNSPSTPITAERRVMIFIELLERYVSGQEMFNKVDFSEGY